MSRKSKNTYSSSSIFLTRVSKFFQRVIFILQKTIQKTFRREKENEELIEIRNRNGIER